MGTENKNQTNPKLQGFFSFFFIYFLFPSGESVINVFVFMAFGTCLTWRCQDHLVLGAPELQLRVAVKKLSSCHTVCDSFPNCLSTKSLALEKHQSRKVTEFSPIIT